MVSVCTGIFASLVLAVWSVTGSQPSCVSQSTTSLVNCSSSSLTSIPTDISSLLSVVTHLDLHGNRINYIPIDEDQWPLWTNLTFLDLSHNALVNLSLSWLGGLQSIQYLNLSNNRISSVSIPELCSLRQLRHVNLANNLIANFTYAEGNYSSSECSLSNVVSVDLSGNKLSMLPEHFLQGLSEVRLLNVSRNHLSGLPANLSQSLANLRILDLSHNLLSNLETDLFSHLHELTHLYLDHNNLSFVSPVHFNNISQLSFLSLGSNPLMHIHAFSFSNCNNLLTLDLSHLTHLSSVHHLAFKGLHALQVLNLTGCSSLAYLHARTFEDLTSLQKLDISNNALTTLFEPIFQNMTSSTEVSVQGNPLVCDCELEWLYVALQSNTTSLQFPALENIICSGPSYLQGLTLAYLDTSEFLCSAPLIVNYTAEAYAPVGSSVVLNCVASGCPHPIITWITPRNQVFRYDPASILWDKPQPLDSSFHAHHHWHLEENHYHELPVNEHIHVLQNGSLFFDYVKRTDAGNYTCFVENSFGNDTVLIEFKLDYQEFMNTIAFSVLVGYACAGCFFLITVLISILRYVSFQCSKEQRQKRKSIYQILESLDNYRSASLGKFRDYKSAKMDQLSAYKSAKVDKLRNVKNVYFTTLVSYMEKMRENYVHSLNKIKENCRQQMEHLRENYASQKGKFRDYRSYQMDRLHDYRSHQMDKLHENYSNQVLKVREYGASQVVKLREQYKMQQQHIMKILEVLDIGSCMTVIEAECMRTESALFDDLDFDLEPPYSKTFLQRSTESEYETADSSDVSSLQNTKPEDRKDSQSSASRPSDLPLDDSKTKEKRKKLKFKRHRRQPSNISTDTSVSQGTPEIIPVIAQVLSHYESSEDSTDAKNSSPSAYVSALSENGSNTEYESAISRPSSLRDIPEKCDASTPDVYTPGEPDDEQSDTYSNSSSCTSTPTMKADVVIAMEAEDELSLSADTQVGETFV